MASSAGKWREEQILIICPGSQTTMAQLGCNELTPPTHRLPTRMFRDGREWRPYYTYKRAKQVNGVDEEEWVEDVDEDKGATWPIQGGRIVNMDALLAFLEHVHALLTTTYHNTPIMLMASPQWTRGDCEAIAQYVFEKTRTPALCIIHSGIATQYGLKWPSMTVVDIGYEKVDVTAIHDGRVVNHMDLGAPGSQRQISGGEVFTKKLHQLLEGKGFSHDMAEQLKRSSVCEVLPYVGTAEKLMELPVDNTPSVQPSAPAPSAAPVKPAELPNPTTGQTEERDDVDGKADEDGVLDVASIVTSGQTKEFLAKREKEKNKPGRKPKADKEAEAAAGKPLRLPNSKRLHNSFFYEEIVQEEVSREEKEKEKEREAQKEAQAGGATGVPTENAPSSSLGENMGNPLQTDGPVPEPGTEPAAPKPEGSTADMAEAKAEPQPDKVEEKAAEATQSNDEPPELRPRRVRRDIEVGLERFTFADREEIDRIVSAIYRTVQGVDDMWMRPACWENLAFVGNGARLRGLKENILQTLNARHLVSPSTATMFTSELPSNMATPTGTGAQTPTGSFTGAPHQLPPTGGVNPLLQAATTASLGGPGAGLGPGVVATPQAPSEAGGPMTTHHFHSQTPTHIKTATLPTYLSEWTKNGFEEAMFLGAQVAARIAFCLHSNMDAQSVEAQRLMSFSRVDYNELGPKGVRTHSMLG